MRAAQAAVKVVAAEQAARAAAAVQAAAADPAAEAVVRAEAYLHSRLAHQSSDPRVPQAIVIFSGP